MTNGVRASIDLIACPWTPARDEATIRSQYETLLSLGINAFEAGWGHLGIGQWRDGAGIEVVIDRIYNLAAEYGIKVYWYTSIHRIPWINPDTGETFVGRYKNFPACAGWSYADEPALKNYEHQGCKNAKDLINSIDPNHPVIPVFSADLETARYMFTMHPAWGDLYDVSCTDIYPYARSDNPEGFLAYRSQLTYHYTGKSPYWGFEHWQPRDHIAWIQAFKGTTRPVIPDIVAQYKVLKNGGSGGGLTFAGWGNRLKGIGFYPASAYLFASGAEAENIRNQIKDLARLLGWQEGVEEVITEKTIVHSCGATIGYQVSSFPENNSPLTCSYGGLPLGVEGIAGSEVVIEEPAPVFTCPQCGATFTTQADLDEHINREHPPLPPRFIFQRTCPTCKSILVLESIGVKRIGGVLEPGTPAICPVCGTEVYYEAKKITFVLEVTERKPWPPEEEIPIEEEVLIVEEPKVIIEEPLILAEPEPVKAKILTLDWLKENKLWVGIGLVGLALFITLVKD